MRNLSSYIPKTVITSDGLRIYYETTPSLHVNKKTLIFIHGLGGDLTAWDTERTAFENLGYATVALDLRGHGLSERAEDESYYSFDKFPLDVQAIIEREKIQNSVIVGHCLGGMVALTFEVLSPKNIKALILVDTSYKPATTTRLIADHKILNKMLVLFTKYAPNFGVQEHTDFSQFIGTKDISIKRFLSDVMHTTLRSYFEIYHKMLSFDATELLEKISIPTLIIEGENDSIFPPKVAQALHKRIKKSQLEVIKDANHILVLNNPEELVATIQSFLEKIY